MEELLIEVNMPVSANQSDIFFCHASRITSNGSESVSKDGVHSILCFVPPLTAERFKFSELRSK